MHKLHKKIRNNFQLYCIKSYNKLLKFNIFIYNIVIK